MQMMKVRFAHPRKIGAKLYPKGVHSVPKEMEKHWFFQAQLKDGSCSVMPEEQEEKQEEKKAPVKPQPQSK